MLSNPFSCNKTIDFLSQLYSFILFPVSSSRERLLKERKRNCGPPVPNGQVIEMAPLHELPSSDDLASNNGVESWLETSSKYHSCEIVDN